MRHDEQIRESDIPPHYPVRILEEGRINCLCDCLRGALISRDEGTAVHLIRWQRVDPSLELVDDFTDGRCWLAGGAIMHGCQSSLTTIRCGRIGPMRRQGQRFAFDPVLVGRSECEAWVGYYRRNWPRMMAGLLG